MQPPRAEAPRIPSPTGDRVSAAARAAARFRRTGARAAREDGRRCSGHLVSQKALVPVPYRRRARLGCRTRTKAHQGCGPGRGSDSGARASRQMRHLDATPRAYEQALLSPRHADFRRGFCRRNGHADEGLWRAGGFRRTYVGARVAVCGQTAKISARSGNVRAGSRSGREHARGLEET